MSLAVSNFFWRCSIIFEKGQSVIYPHYGAGEIIEVEEIDRDGETDKYLVIDIHLRQQTVKIPADSVDEVGVRELCDEDEFYEKLEEAREFILDSYDPEENSHPEKIHQQTLKSLQSDIQEGALKHSLEGLKKLHTRFLDQELNITEKRVYDTVRQFIVGEIMGIEDCSRKQAEDKLEEYLPTELPEAEDEEDE